MAAVDDPKVLGPARLSFANEADIGVFVETLARFERGEISPDEWRAFRLVHGTYGQRQEGEQMLRVKIPQGILDGAQLRAIAEVSRRFARGIAHVTTRQNLQLHFLKLPEVETAMRLLAEAGLTTREACGNSVRNITACAYAGVAADEPFDPTPWAEALTRYLLRHPLSSTLPRKFKIAFEGCAEDHAVTAINDLGFRVRVVAGVAGFRVTVGGGTAILPTSARVLLDFVAAEEIAAVVEGVLRVYHRLGDREHRNRNRLKFLIRELGWEKWHEAFTRAWEKALREGIALAPEPSAERPVPARTPLPPLPREGFDSWRRTNVRAQKQAGFSVATVTLPLGDLTSGRLDALAALAEELGDGTVRTTTEQNLVLRWIRDEDLPALHGRLAAAGLALPGAATIADVTSCPGAESCRLAVTRSRGLASLLRERLTVRSGPDLALKVSGCPNGCGQHHIAGIGFQGSVRRVGGKAVPQYFVMTGGGAEVGGTFFAKTAARIPARRVPAAVDRLVALYEAERAEGEKAPAFFRRVGTERLKALLSDLEKLTPEEATADDFVDLGETSAFAVTTMEGECAS